jgi:hypothetical protein
MVGRLLPADAIPSRAGEDRRTASGKAKASWNLKHCVFPRSFRTRRGSPHPTGSAVLDGSLIADGVRIPGGHRAPRGIPAWAGERVSNGVRFPIGHRMASGRRSRNEAQPPDGGRRAGEVRKADGLKGFWNGAAWAWDSTFPAGGGVQPRNVYRARANRYLLYSLTIRASVPGQRHQSASLTAFGATGCGTTSASGRAMLNSSRLLRI